ncbi:MAG: hypothetical protein ACRYF4_00245 [Janthinobacterium lividum]
MTGPRPAAPARYKAWQWQRTIQPAAGVPLAEQCVVLDAELYAASAPGLRDVRLLQDGREVAYALQESYDERAVHTAGGVDRAVYMTVLSVPLSADSGLERGTAVLPQHVPVERIELVPGTDEHGAAPATPSHGTVHLRLVATPQSANASAPGEVIEDDLDAARPIERTAIGANLQHEVHVDVLVNAGAEHFSHARLQMHERSLCYQPLSSAPLLLLYGNADALPVRSAYAAHYRPTAEALLASPGPAQRNVNYQSRVSTTFTLTRLQRLGLAVFVAAAGFLLTAVPLLRRR